MAIVARVPANYILEEKEVYDLGQKVNPHGIRVGIEKTWESKWYEEKSHKEKGSKKKHKGRYFAKIKAQQFTRRVMRKSKKRLVLPRNRLLA